MKHRPAACVVLLLLAACGQRGDLFIPEPPAREAVATVPAGSAAAPEPDATDDDEAQRSVAPPPADPVPGR